MRIPVMKARSPLNTAALLAIQLALTATACAGPPGAPRATGLPGPGPFEGGVDIPDGVYTAHGADCFADTARTRTFDLTADNEGDDDLIAASGLVRGVQRIAVHRGEFLRVDSACRWQLEDRAHPTPDPETLAGGCTILVSDGLVRQAVAWLLNPQRDHAAGFVLQDRLMAVVYGERLTSGPHTTVLWKPAGDLVDFIDAPSFFITDGVLDPRVTRAVARINRRCAPG